MRLRARIFLADGKRAERWVCTQCGYVEKAVHLAKAAVRLREPK